MPVIIMRQFFLSSSNFSLSFSLNFIEKVTTIMGIFYQDGILILFIRLISFLFLLGGGLSIVFIFNRETSGRDHDRIARLLLQLNSTL